MIKLLKYFISNFQDQPCLKVSEDEQQNKDDGPEAKYREMRNITKEQENMNNTNKSKDDRLTYVNMEPSSQNDDETIIPTFHTYKSNTSIPL